MMGAGRKRSLDGRSEPLIDRDEQAEEVNTATLSQFDRTRSNLTQETVENELIGPPCMRKSVDQPSDPRVARGTAETETRRLPAVSEGAEASLEDPPVPQPITDKQSNPPPPEAPTFWDSFFANPVAKTASATDDADAIPPNQLLEYVGATMAGIGAYMGSYEPPLSATNGSPAFTSVDGLQNLQQKRVQISTDVDVCEVDSKVPSAEGWQGKVAQVRQMLRGPIILVGIVMFMASGFIYGASKEFGYEFHLFENIDWEEELNVAFVGNAYLFVNDVPRVVQALSGDYITQNSVIHPGGSLGSLLYTGNGMYKAWKTDNAYIGERYIENYGGARSMYDFGVCSVRQLLLGYDDYVAYGNSYGLYKNDGLNPCLSDEYYYNFVADYLTGDPIKWDYVVLADQTKRMAIASARNDTLQELISSYGPWLNMSGAIPVIVDTHAFWSQQTNMTGLGDDVPSFTANIREGVHEYAAALGNFLPFRQKPIVAPVGLAYLTVYQENYELWEMLFVRDKMHASVYGTYLFACVLYMTLYGHRLPDEDAYYPEELVEIFGTSRKLVGQYIAYPNPEEAAYLRGVAKKVTLRGHVPSFSSKRGR